MWSKVNRPRKANAQKSYVEKHGAQNDEQGTLPGYNFPTLNLEQPPPKKKKYVEKHQPRAFISNPDLDAVGPPSDRDVRIVNGMIVSAGNLESQRSSARPPSERSNAPKRRNYMEQTYFRQIVTRDSILMRNIYQMMASHRQGATDIKLFANETKPSISVEYVKDGIRDRDKIEFVFYNAKKRHQHQIFRDFMSLAYEEVPDDCKAVKEGVFKLLEKSDKKMRFTKRKETMFFYSFSKANNAANFCLYDDVLNVFEAAENSLLGLASKAQIQDEIVRLRQPKNQVAASNERGEFGFDDEVDSDDQNTKKRYTRKNQFASRDPEARVTAILQKDLSTYESTLEAKREEWHELALRDPDDKIDAVNDQISKIEQGIESFQSAKSKAQEMIKQFNQTKASLGSVQHQKQCQTKFYKGLKPQLVMAERHLESNLPIVGKKDEIVRLLKNSQVIVLEGETGSGKSTQLPQILAEHFQVFSNSLALPILVTQPRKLATRTLAERVAFELEQPIGESVDYVCAGHKKSNPSAKIVFKMDRLVLDELIDDPLLSRYSCIVVDEAHERTMSIDLVLGFVKSILPQRPDFRAIVTSASMEVKLFADFFNSKVLKVEGRLFPVQISYKDYNRDDVVTMIRKVLTEEVFQNSRCQALKPQYNGDVLVFCSGVDEIDKLCEQFGAKLAPEKFQVLPLHGALDPEEQRKVFLRTSVKKVIFCTRVAETSVTIDGVKVVVDPGFDRQSVYDQKSRISSIKMVDISKSAAKQRAGRAGRTSEGYCFRLYREDFFLKMRDGRVPDILNNALDTVVLRLKSLRIDDVVNFPYLESPDKEALQQSVKAMKSLQAIGEDDKISRIGWLLVQLPIEPFLARAIIEAMIVDEILKSSTTSRIKAIKAQASKLPPMLDTIIEILALLTQSSNLFRIPMERGDGAEEIKFNNFADESGDFFMLKKVYDAFKERLDGKNSQRTGNVKAWMRSHFLNPKALFQAKSLVEEMSHTIKNMRTKLTANEMSKQFAYVRSKLIRCESYNDAIMSCLITSFCLNLAIFSGNTFLGYTVLSSSKNVNIYGSSILSLIANNPTWIICHDLFNNKDGKLFTRIAHAVRFSFLLDHTHPSVLEQYKIEQIDKISPLYQQKKVVEPSFILEELRKWFRKYRDDEKARNIKQIEMTDLPQCNTINFYAIKKSTEGKQESWLETTINNEIRRIKEQIEKPYFFNFFGNIFMGVGNGGQVIKVRLDSFKHSFLINLTDSDGFPVLEEELSKYEPTKMVTNLKMKITTSEDSKVLSIKKFLKEFEKDYPRYSEEGFRYEEQFDQMKYKVPETRIRIEMHTGEKYESIYLNYSNQVSPDSNNQKVNGLFLRQLIGYLQQFQEQASLVMENRALNLYAGHPRMNPNEGLLETKKAINVFRQGTFQPNKANTGINFYFGNKRRIGNLQIEPEKILHQSELADIIRFFAKEATIPFRMPLRFTAFRKLEAKYSDKNEAWWADQLKKHIDQLPTAHNHYIFKVWGWKFTDKKDKKRINSKQQVGFTDVTADIRTFSKDLAMDLIKKFDQRVILGPAPIHAYAMYEQVAAKISDQVFQALKPSIQAMYSLLLTEYPSLEIDPKRINIKYPFYLIICRSRIKWDLSISARRIKDLLTAKIYRLNLCEKEFLASKKGAGCLYEIQLSLQFQAVFEFVRFPPCLRIYCADSMTQTALKAIKDYLGGQKNLSEYVSYRGKNLFEVKRVLDELTQKKAAQRSFAYTIMFGKRELSLEGTYQSISEAKTLLNRIVSIEQNVCEVCYFTGARPYHLLNCKHIFCWECLANHIREFRSLGHKILICPNDGCKAEISVYDIKSILTEDEFNSLIEVKLKQYLSNSQQYISCPNPECMQVFAKDSTQIDCQMCGLSNCLKCKQSHPNFTCEEWERKDFQISDEDLKKLGMKRCSNCHATIQKNGGCHHMSCKCGAHVCWLCTAAFKTSTECYGHLTKVHGRISDQDLF